MRSSPVLFLHICGALLGILSGAVAMSFRKGSRAHGLAGKVFVVSMMTMSASATYLAVRNSEMMNFLMGVLTFYLVATAWSTARRKDDGTTVFDWGGALVVLAVGAGFLTYGLEAAFSPTGLKGRMPAAGYFVFGSVPVLCVVGDFRMLLRGGVSGAKRIARHLWRMSFAFFIAVMSLFLGKQQHFPAALRGSPVMAAPPLLVLVLMIYWMVRVLRKKSSKRAAALYPNRAPQNPAGLGVQSLHG